MRTCEHVTTRTLHLQTYIYNQQSTHSLYFILRLHSICKSLLVRTPLPFVAIEQIQNVSEGIFKNIDHILLLLVLRNKLETISVNTKILVQFFTSYL